MNPTAKRIFLGILSTAWILAALAAVTMAVRSLFR